MKRAIISVYNKAGLSELVPYLERHSYIMYSTGGTATEISKYVKNISSLQSISKFTPCLVV